MNEADSTDSPRVWPMDTIYRGCLIALGLMGLVALAMGVTGLLHIPLPGLHDGGPSVAEAAAVLLAGLGMAAFALTAVRHARLELDATEMRYLRFGVLCRTGRIPLARIRRFGVGSEGSRSGLDHILLLDIEDAGRTSIKLSMYSDWESLVTALGEHLGQKPAPTKRTWKGAAFDDGD